MPSAPITARKRTYRALLIGNASFPKDPRGLWELRGPEMDLRLMFDALTDPDTGLHDPVDVSAVFDAPRADILHAMRKFFENSAKGDQLLLYYSGHGRLTAENDLYLCANDTEAVTTAALRTTGIAAKEISGLIESGTASATIVVLDCCYAGAFKGVFEVPGFLQGQGRFGLYSCQWYEESPDAGTWDAASPFTATVARALRMGTLDANRDGFADLDDVYGYVYHQLQSLPGPLPARRIPSPATGTVALARASKLRPDARPVLPPEVILPTGPPILISVPDRQCALGQFLVTNQQYAGFLADPANRAWLPEAAIKNKRVDGDYLRHWRPSRTFPAGQAHYPVVHVSAEAAQAYADWAAGQVGRRVRLPTCDEWQAAALAGRSLPEAIATEIRRGGINYHMAERALTEVGLFAANPYGFSDLFGNADDLCLDGGHRVSESTVMRCGGSFSSPRPCLGERQPVASPSTCRGDTGFRCAADLEDARA